MRLSKSRLHLLGSVPLALLCLQLSAQRPADFLNLDALAAQSEPLLAQARTHAGYASAPQIVIGGHAANLTARTLSGGGEIHEHLSDLMIVLAGEGTELTGGTVLDAHATASGEIRGTRLDGATPHLLHKGDLLHIPAGTPHQAVLNKGQYLTTLVVKIEEPAQRTQP